MNKLAIASLALLAAAPAAARTLRWAKDGSGDAKTLEKLLEQSRPGDVVALEDQGLFGAAIRKYGGYVRVDEVLSGGGAEAAGVKNGDLLSIIEGQTADSLTIDDAMDLLRGRAGTTVRVTVVRGSEKPKEVQAVRHASTVAIRGDEDKARVAFAARQPKAALRFEELAAKGGSVEAMKVLVHAYHGHYGVPRDDRKAVAWIRAIAEKGDGKGQGLLARAYLVGEGAAKDRKQFAHWAELSASNGDAYGQYLMGFGSQYGLGMPKDASAAARWYHKAELQGLAGASKALAALRSGASAKAPAAAEPAPAIVLQPAPADGTAEPAPSAVDRPSYARAPRPDDVAVVIGVEKYTSVPPATYAERDARAVRAHLVALGYPERNIFSLIGPSATKSAFIKELETRLSRVAKPGSTVFVYYSGHGAPDPKTGAAYLLPYDGDPEFLDDTAYPLKRLYEKLGALKARRVVVALDSCFSGAGGRSVLAKGVRPLVTKADPALAASGKVAALTAASGGEISGALDEQAHGLFTYYLLEGLNKGKTSLGDLAAYVTPKVEDEARRHNRDQTPQLLGADAAQADLSR